MLSQEGRLPSAGTGLVVRRSRQSTISVAPAMMPMAP
jgi:hypothetical protein